MKVGSFWSMLVCLVWGSLHAQTPFQVHGMVQLENQAPGAGVVVLLMSQDTLKMLGYHVTGPNGAFQIALKNSQDTMVLKASYLGYQPFFQQLSINTSRDPLNIRLLPDTRSLPEILVQGTSTGIKVNGDTTRYQLEKWRTGQEKNLGDLLNALPGLEINEQGKVLYQGKPVEVLLLEDKEVVGQQHQLATRGISADQVIGVELIDQFKDLAQQFRGEVSEKRALRIQLKDGDQSKWLKHLLLGAGLEKKAEADGTVIHTQKKIGWSVLAKFNSIGQAVLTPSDYLELQTDMVRFLLQNQMKAPQEILPPGLQIPETLQSNRDALAVTQLDWKPGRNLQIKSSTLWTDLTRDAASNVLGYLPNADQYWQAAKTGQSGFSLFQHQSALTFKPSASHLLELFLPVEWNRAFVNESVNAGINALAQRSNLDQKNEVFQFSPDLQWTWKKSERWTVLSNYRWRYEHRPFRTRIKGEQDLFDTPFHAVEQRGKASGDEKALRLSLRYKQHVHQLTLEGSYLNIRQLLDASANATVFNGTDQWNHERLGGKLTWWVRAAKWEWRSHLEMVRSKFTHLQGQHKAIGYVQPSAYLKYHFKPLQQLSISAGSSRSVPAFQQLSPIGIVTDAYQYRIGWGDSLFLPLGWSAQLFYFRLNGLNKNITTASLQWSTLRSNYATWLNARSNYLIEQTGWTEAGNILSAKWDNTRELPGQRKWLLQLQALQQDWPLLNEAGPLSQRWQMLAVSTALKQTKGLGWNWRLAYSWRWNKMQGPLFQKAQLAQVHQPACDLSYQTKQWLFEVNLEHFLLLTQENILSRPMIRAKIQWQSAQGKWYFGIRGNDLSYLRGTPMQKVDFLPNQIRFSNYRRFPGYILLFAERYW